MDYGSTSVQATVAPPASSTDQPRSITSDVVSSPPTTTIPPTTTNPNTDPPSTTTTNGMTNETSSSSSDRTTIASTTTTTTYIEPTTSSSPTIDPTTPPSTPDSGSTTRAPPNQTTTTPGAVVPPPDVVSSTTKEVVTSTPVPIVTVTSSGTVVRTYTSTSYSSYITHIATALPGTGNQSGEQNNHSNTGAIAGGVVGGVAAIALIGFLFFCCARRRRNKKNNAQPSYESDLGDEDPKGNNAYMSDYNTYGSPTVVSSDNGSQAGRPLSMSTVPSQGMKPRPFVQAYNPTYDGSQQYAAYDGTHSPAQDPYYQAYNYNNNNSAYPHDAYYAHQQEPMMPVSNSTTGLSGRNVPDENDYDLQRKVSRHVPDEVSSVPHTR